MKISLYLLLPLTLLAACGSEPEPEPAQTEPVAAPEPVSTLPPPDEARFAEVMAAACPAAEPVNTSVCRRAMGAPTVSCKFGLGDDEALRHDATLEIDEAGEAWILTDAEAVCTTISD